MAAIYTPMWPIDIEVTTTLYPVDVTESVNFGAAPINETGWSKVLEDTLAGGFSIGIGTLKDVRFTAPEQGPEILQ